MCEVLADTFIAVLINLFEVVLTQVHSFCNYLKGSGIHFTTQCTRKYRNLVANEI